jgi:hypothetical protein
MDILHHLVDDRVKADVDLLPLGEVGTLRLRPNVEPDDDGRRCRGKHHVRLGDSPHSPVDDVHLDFLPRELVQRILERFQGALHVRFDDDVQSLQLAFLDSPVEFLQTEPRAGDHFFPLFFQPVDRDLPGGPLVAQHGELLPGGG